MDQTIQTIADRLRTSKRNVLCLHRRPDGDSIGSCLAMAAVLRTLGQEATIYSLDPVPEYLSFLPGAKDVIVQSPDQIHWHDYTTFWALDMASEKMLGAVVEFPKEVEVIVIDHHQTNVGWGTTNLIRSDEISCSSILYDVLQECKVEIPKEAGFAMLTGLCTDSGFFQHIKDGKPLRDAAQLIDTFGLNYQEITYHIQKQMNIEDILFIGNALALMQVDYDRKVAVLPIPYKNWLNFGEAGENTHLLTGYLQSINGTEFGVMVIEEKPGLFRLQFRSRNREFDVAALAAQLGGGGHKNAAGATVEGGTPDDVINRIKALL